MRLFDTHCHLDLYPDYKSVVSEIDANRLFTIAVTTTPSVFAKSSEIAGTSPWIKTALGMHPELVSKRQAELSLFLSLMGTTRFIGEVGLDFVDNDPESKTAQERVFSTILDACAADSRKIITIHSRRAAERVVEMIGPSYPATTILHWFTGSASTLKKAIANGCFFSINPVMTLSPKGRDLIKQIPIERLLLESDGPFATVAGRPCRPKDTIVSLRGIATTINKGEEELSEILESNLDNILGVQPRA